MAAVVHPDVEMVEGTGGAATQDLFRPKWQSDDAPGVPLRVCRSRANGC